MRPAASPSRPSTKFTALIATTTTSTVTTSESREDPIVRPKMGNVMSCTPCHAITPAASTCPASFVIQSRSQMSSAAPSRQTSPAEPRIAHGRLSAKTPDMNAIRDATSIATVMPMSIATPPRRGVGAVWTSRPRTGVSTWLRFARVRASGVARYVTAAAIAMRRR